MPEASIASTNDFADMAVVRSGAKEFVLVSIICLMLNQVVAYVASVGNSRRIIRSLGFYSILIQWVVFIHASGQFFGNERTERYFDLTGSVTFVLLSLSSALTLGFSNISTRQVICTTCILVWSTRLGAFLFSRISHERGTDSRFTDIKKNVFHFWNVWTIQGVWVFLTALPVFCLNSYIDKGPSYPTSVDLLGLFIWAFGLTLESVADWQKSRWKADPLTAGRFIDTGLWSISRHPNYFGEICVWVGLVLASCKGYTQAGQWIALISPLFVAFLLIFVSGIPMLEKKAETVWRDDKSYKRYKEVTPVLIPFIGGKGNSMF